MHELPLFLHFQRKCLPGCWPQGSLQTNAPGNPALPLQASGIRKVTSPLPFLQTSWCRDYFSETHKTQSHGSMHQWRWLQRNARGAPAKAQGSAPHRPHRSHRRPAPAWYASRSFPRSIRWRPPSLRRRWSAQPPGDGSFLAVPSSGKYPQPKRFPPVPGS